MHLPCAPTNPLLGIHPEEMETYIHTKTRVLLFIRALLLMVKIWKEPDSCTGRAVEQAAVRAQRGRRRSCPCRSGLGLGSVSEGPRSAPACPPRPHDSTRRGRGSAGQSSGHSCGVGGGWRGRKDTVFGQRRERNILNRELTDSLGGGISERKTSKT